MSWLIFFLALEGVIKTVLAACSPYTCTGELIPIIETCTCDCPDGKYASGAVCLWCSSAACKKCTLFGSYECYTPYLKYNDTCVASCPSGYGMTDSKLGCTRCSDSSCTNCQNNYAVCEACPAGYILIFNSCMRCYTGCATCTNSGYNSCGSCISGYYLWYNVCYSTCPDGTGVNGGICSGCKDIANFVQPTTRHVHNGAQVIIGPEALAHHAVNLSA